MQKIIIPVSKCIPGMVTAQPIVDLQTSATILSQNQEITSHHLKDLKNFIHSDIWVYLDSFDKVWRLDPKIIEQYKLYSNLLNAVITHSDENNAIDFDKFEELCSHISVNFTADYNLLGCTNLIKSLSYDTYTHSLNVAFLSVLLCKWTKMDEISTQHAIKAALLHDIGSINLPFDINGDLDLLTTDQRVEYEKHPIYSYNIVSKMPDLDPIIAKSILAHHERCDGSGFPIRITSPYLNNITRILSIADRYELLMKNHHIFDTLKILLTEDLARLDTDKLLTFCNHIANYYIGVFITLSNGVIGEVVFINPKCIYRPIVKVNENFINLYETPSIGITSIE